MWKIIYSMKKYWTFHIKSLWILLHWYWKQISFETNITSLWKIDFLILLRLHFIFTILLLIWKNRKLRLGVDRWRVELELELNLNKSSLWNLSVLRQTGMIPQNLNWQFSKSTRIYMSLINCPNSRSVTVQLAIDQHLVSVFGFFRREEE